MQLLTIPAFAATEQRDVSIDSQGIESEITAAEELLGGPCKLESAETEIINGYVVENRLYVLDMPESRANSGKTGGVSSQVWYPLFSQTWTIKVMVSGFFYYNGTTAICIPEESDIWAVDSNNTVLDEDLQPQFSYKDGATAKVSCNYSIVRGGVVEIAANLGVTCSKTGQVGIVSEEEHRY